MKVRNMRRVVTGLALAGLLAGCGKDSTGPLVQTVKEPKLMKLWEGRCKSSELLDLSSRVYYRFQDTGYTEVHTFFENADCNNPAAELTYRGNVLLKGEAAANLKQMDLLFEDAELKPVSDKGRQLLEKASFCGVAHWALGAVVNLKGKTGTLGCPLRKVPSGEYNVYSLEEETLFLGKTSLRGGATVEKDRPTSVERDEALRPSARSL